MIDWEYWLFWVGGAAPGLVVGLLVALWLAPTGLRVAVLLVAGLVPIVVVVWLLVSILDLRDWTVLALYVQVFLNWGTWVIGVLVGAAVRAQTRPDYADVT